MRNYLFGAIFGIMLFLILYLKLCNEPVVNNSSDAIPIKDQVAKVVSDSVLIKKIIDSVSLVSKVWENQSFLYRSKFSASVSEYKVLEKDYKELIEILNNSDDSKYIELKNKFDKLSEVNREKDNNCTLSILSLENSLLNKEKIISLKDSSYKKIRDAFDISLAQQKILEDKVSQNKKRNQFFLGASLNGSPEKIISGFGVSAGLISKKNSIIELGAFTLNNNVNYSVSYKTIISFRKRK